MLEFYLRPEVIGTADAGLFVSSEGYAWHRRRPTGVWCVRPVEILPGEVASVNDVVKLEGKILNLSPPDRFTKSVVGIPEGSRPLWSMMLSRRDYRSFLDSLVHDIHEATTGIYTSYYETAWTAHTKLFNSIQRFAKPNEDILNESGNSDVAGFKSRFGFCEPIVYNRIGTRTGRLTISSGPPILTLKKDARKFLRSRWGDNGVLLSLDFSALEVRLLMSDDTSQVTQQDPYIDLSHSLNGLLDRTQSKLALISTVYGSSEHGLTQSLGLPLSEVSKVHNVITSKFGVEKLVNRLRSEFLDKKCIRNKYGRRIALPDSSDGTLLNSYLQSTGVDVALWGFLEIVNRLNEEWAVPVAVLHDALILDVTKEFAQKIGESLAVQVPGYIGKFPLKISIFNS